MAHKASLIPRLHCPDLSHSFGKRSLSKNCKTNSRVESLGFEAALNNHKKVTSEKLGGDCQLWSRRS